MFFALGVKTLSVPESIGSYFREEKWFSKKTFGEEKRFSDVPSANYQVPSKHPTHTLAHS